MSERLQVGDSCKNSLKVIFPVAPSYLRVCFGVYKSREEALLNNEICPEGYRLKCTCGRVEL